MSNLLKCNNVVIKDKDKMVIDSNSLLNSILEQRAIRVDDTRVADSDGFITGLEAATVEELVADEELMADSLQTEEERQAILEEAREEAKRIKAEARQQGYEDGMNASKADSQQELESMRNGLEQEYQNKMVELQKEFEEMKAKAEPELVEVLLKVFTRVTHVMAEDKKDVILHLIDGVMRDTESNREFLIRVSDEDYNFVENNKNKLYGSTAAEIKIDICKDSKLERNQCIIENESGVFDCSLDIQLENLIEEIRLLTCMN